MPARSIGLPLLCAVLSIVGGRGAEAAALTVSPITVDAGTAANTTITLQNKGPRPMNAQVRVFRWRQDGGEDSLLPAEDVVASPPIVTVQPNGLSVVRLQRLSTEQPFGEDAYRVVVDELPDPNRQRNGTVAVVLRYLVPAFYFGPDASQPRVSWSITRLAGRPTLVASNRGDRRLQVSDLRLKAGGRVVMLCQGLAGYVLGRSEKTWPLPAKLGPLRGVSIVAGSDHGPLNASLSP